MDSKLQKLVKNLKDKGLLTNILNNLNLSSYNDLLLLIDKQISTYIENLRMFLTRLFGLCYGRPLREFNKFPLEVLIYFVHEKEQELENCYHLLKKNNIYLHLKKIPSEKEYKKILKLLAMLGENIATVYKLDKKYKNFANNLKLDTAMQLGIRDSQKTLKGELNKKKTFFLPGSRIIFLVGVVLSIYFIFSLKTRNEELLNTIQIQTKKIENLKTENNKLKEHLNLLQQKYSTLLMENEKLKNIIQIQSKKLESFKDNTYQVRKKLNLLQRKYLTLLKEKRILEAKLLKLKKEIAQLKTQKNNTNQEKNISQ